MARAILIVAFLIGLGFGSADVDMGSRRALEADALFRLAVQLKEKPTEARQIFRQSAQGYEQLWRLGLRSPGLCRNQGNAYLLAGDLPRAILAYRRGLQLAPNDRDLQRGLAYAREQVVYPANSPLGRQPIDHWPPWLPRPTPGPFLMAALVCYTLGWVFLARWRMMRRGRLLRVAATAFVTMAILGAGWAFLAWQKHEETNHPLAVIAAEKVVVRKGDGPSFPSRFELHAGVETRVRYDGGKWLQIELASGEIGWVPRGAVAMGQ